MSTKTIYEIVTADISESEEIARLINEAYFMETGDTGVAFLNCPRLAEPLPPYLRCGYEEGRILKVVNSKKELCAMICYQWLEDAIYFGPFAVRPSLKGQGVGSLLMNEVYRLGRLRGNKYCEISVIDCRTDIIPMYEKLGYVRTGEVKDFPRPEELTRPVQLVIYRKDISVLDASVDNPRLQAEVVAPVATPVVTAPPAASATAPAPSSLFVKKSIFTKEAKPVQYDESKSPWASINDMLVQNRCWLCEQSFPRGKQKKVFQLSNLLQYYTDRLKSEDGLSSTEVNADGNAASGTDDAVSVTTGTVEVPVMTSRNFKRCYDSFAALMREDPLGEKKKMRDEFVANDVEVWMSGLACGLNPDCRRDLSMFIDLKPSYGNSTSTGTGGDGTFMKFDKDGKECPPGCGCDNPWPFLS